MAQEVYFDYGDRIKSRRLCEAIAIPNAVGPLCGFGSAKVEGTNLCVYPYALGDSNSASEREEDRDPLRYQVRSKIDGRFIPGENVTTPMYALISRDGTLWRSTTNEGNCIKVPISGTPTKEYFLFAVHEPVTEAVSNPVTFKAYYNNSSISFYDIFKKSRNIYYPTTDADLIGTITKVDDSDPFLTAESTFNYLEGKVEVACDDFKTNKNRWVLIGVYGEGTDVQTQKPQKFSIVPYQASGISELPYNFGIHDYLTKALNRIETFLYKDLPTDVSGNIYTSLKKFVEDTVSNAFNELKGKVNELQTTVEENVLQAGSIILWDGDQVPAGWEEYSKANGRIVIGFTEGGIKSKQGDVLKNIGDVYNPSVSEGSYTIEVKGDSLPKHRHGVGIEMGRHDNVSEAFGVIPCNFNNRRTDMNGTAWDSKYNCGIYIANGAVMSSYNLHDGESTTNEVSNTTMTLDKLLPAITLRYIRKSNSYKAIT